jgi:hypothetical protein
MKTTKRQPTLKPRPTGTYIDILLPSTFYPIHEILQLSEPLVSQMETYSNVMWAPVLTAVRVPCPNINLTYQTSIHNSPSLLIGNNTPEMEQTIIFMGNSTPLLQ